MSSPELTKTHVSKLSIRTLGVDRSRRSFCWTYFGNLIVVDGNKKKIHNSDQVYCLACLNAVKIESEDITFGSVKIKSYNKTVSTGNLTRHLRDDHQIEDDLSDDQKSGNERNDDDKANIINKKSVAATRPTKTNPSSIKKEPSEHDTWHLAIDLALWFCKSLMPFDYVSDEGMVDFFKKYNIIVSDNEIPSRYTVIGSALSEVYESILNKVKENISVDAASNFAITFDLWTDQRRRLSYITFTLHYLTSDFILKAFTLSTETIIVEETGEIIKTAFEDIKRRFDLNDKNIIAVTDAGRNLIRAISLANTSHHLCLGHSLHKLVIVDGINSVSETAALVQKIKIIVEVLRSRAPELQAKTKKVKLQIDFWESLDRVVEVLKIDECHPIPENETVTIENSVNFEDGISSSLLNLENDNHIPIIQTATPSRWHSVLEMLETVVNISNQDIMNNMLKKIHHNELKITQDEWILLQELVHFLKSFREAVEIMSSQKTCTINVALVFRSEIIDILNTFEDDKSQILLCLKRNMLANIDKRFPVTNSLVAAALLDCRFMSLKEVDAYLDKHNMTRTSFLSSYIKEMINVNDITETIETPSSSKNKLSKIDTSLLQKLSKKHSISARQGNKGNLLEQECWRYFAAADSTEPNDGDLLAFWNKHKTAYPYLSALARALLCVPATSIPNERMFSVTGLNFAERRSQLNPTRVNKIIFIHDNNSNI